ncbi:MAG: transglutaminase family protein [Mariniblastus sp.]
MRSSANSKSKRQLIAGQAASDGDPDFNFHRDLAPSLSVLFVALMAMSTVQMFRSGHSRSLPIVMAEALTFLALPWVAYAILRFRCKNNSKFPFTKTAIFGFQFGAILTGILVLIWHICIRPFGYGDANEIVALLTIQSVGWYLAVFSRVPGFEKASSILSGALVFFVCCIADDRRIFLIAGLFAFAGLWWLLGQYWSRLETKAIDSDSRALKLHGSTVSLTMLAVVLVASVATAIPFTQKGNLLVGFMPFSGGEKGSQSEFAISGIGDGNMLTAGTNATTTGAVESDQFIEDDKPSLYDITSDRYDGPIVKKRRNNAVSLAGIAQQMHEAKKSEQSGRTFRTMRNSSETTDIELQDRITKALFFVEGSVPARFSINNFRQFDGWDWSSLPDDIDESKPPRIILGKKNGLPVFRIARRIASYLTGRRSHRVKIMRLDSSTIPAPALLQQWHIPLVDKLEMFAWSETDLIKMDAESIPSHSIIDVQSLIPNYHLLRDKRALQPARSSDDSNFRSNKSSLSHFLQVPETESQPAVKKLADEWTEGIKPGWMQVESVVAHLRSDFTLNPNWETDEKVEDSVSLFLEQGCGPSYMFATTCAMVLRSAGYKTRVASGFLVQKQHYDARARQSVVTPDNLHMWPEVCLDGTFWIPVEPTPGYPIPYSTQTTWQWLTAKAMTGWYWLLENPLTVTLIIGTTFLAALFRAELITSLMLGWWFLIRIVWPQRLLKTTRQLIDLRFWLAGDRRPSTETISVWYTRVESNAMAAFFNLWNAQNYSENSTSASRQDLVMACRNSVNSLSLKRIRDFRKDNESASTSQ